MVVLYRKYESRSADFEAEDAGRLLILYELQVLLPCSLLADFAELFWY